MTPAIILKRPSQSYEILLIRINQEAPISEQEACPSDLLSSGRVTLMKRLMCNHWLKAMQLTWIDRVPCGKEKRTKMSQLINVISLWHTLINVIQGSMVADQAKEHNEKVFHIYSVRGLSSPWSSTIILISAWVTLTLLLHPPSPK